MKKKSPAPVFFSLFPPALPNVKQVLVLAGCGELADEKKKKKKKLGVGGEGYNFKKFAEHAAEHRQWAQV